MKATVGFDELVSETFNHGSKQRRFTLQAGLRTQNLYAFVSSGTGLAQMAESHSKSHVVRLSETFNHGSWSWFASCFQVSYDPNS